MIRHGQDARATEHDTAATVAQTAADLGFSVRRGVGGDLAKLSLDVARRTLSVDR